MPQRLTAIIQAATLGLTGLCSAATDTSQQQMERLMSIPHHSINYLEIPVTDMAASKAFFAAFLGWRFVDYGPDYAATSSSNLDVGFYLSQQQASANTGSVLMVFYSEDLMASQAQVEAAGGKIIKPTFAFPGGRRFHFSDPSGNEFAIWSDN